MIYMHTMVLGSPHQGRWDYRPDTKHAYMERFNKTYRTEVLDCYVFESLQEVRETTADCVPRYNHYRPHEFLGRIPPVEYRVTLFPNLYFRLAQEFEEGFAIHGNDFRMGRVRSELLKNSGVISRFFLGTSPLMAAARA